jgi:hypothetical protein
LVPQNLLPMYIGGRCEQIDVASSGADSVHS